MKNKFTLSLLLTFAILLTACGSKATAAPAATEAPYTKGDTSATLVPVVATDTPLTDDSGYGNYGNPPPANSTTASNPAGGGGATVSVGSGSLLVGANGMTLYLLTKDSNGTSTCSGGCANNWPPLTVTGQPQAGTGLDTSLLGTTVRPDGSTQVTYNGHPLYYYKGDNAPGDANGQGSGGIWFAVTASGEAMQ